MPAQCSSDPFYVPTLQRGLLLRAAGIANNPELKCLGCGGRIPLSDRIYEPLLSDVKNILEAIDSAALSFVSTRLGRI